MLPFSSISNVTLPNIDLVCLFAFRCNTGRTLARQVVGAAAHRSPVVLLKSHPHDSSRCTAQAPPPRYWGWALQHPSAPTSCSCVWNTPNASTRDALTARIPGWSWAGAHPSRPRLRNSPRPRSLHSIWSLPSTLLSNRFGSCSPPHITKTRRVTSNSRPLRRRKTNSERRFWDRLPEAVHTSRRRKPAWTWRRPVWRVWLGRRPTRGT